MKSPLRIAAMGAMLVASLAAVSCSNKLTEEQLATLKELKRQEARLIAEIKEKESAIQRLESEAAPIKRELKDCEDKKAAIQQRLSQWPNVWPDGK